MARTILLLSLFTFFAFRSQGQQSPEPADKILQEAFAVAAQENKKVFVIFHASWCGWCHKMDAAMNDTSCKKFFEDNFVIRHLVVFESKGKEHLENPGALQMIYRYNGGDGGIPFWLILDTGKKLLADSRMEVKDKDGDVKLQNTGCPATKEEVDYFVSVLRKTTSLNEDELGVIFERFRKNNPR